MLNDLILELLFKNKVAFISITVILITWMNLGLCGWMPSSCSPRTASIHSASMDLSAVAALLWFSTAGMKLQDQHNSGRGTGLLG